MASLELNHVYKVYDNGVKAVNDFTMNVKDKEFIVFVGPSGCGKSTTLRMIAGLEEITAGDIKIDGQVVNDDEPKERDIAMVFQNYALYPHMTVYKNMAFGLKLRHVPKAVIDEKVKAAAKILGLSDYLDRKPKAMSGGQRQRVALGRAIVREPKIFLLDEPLSNLDAKLRASMRSEISKLHKKLKTTFVYVTHDQVEAMTMGTRIVVMKDGFVQQIDSPLNLYKFPVNKFVAGFIGTPQMNFFGGFLKKDKKQVSVNFNEAKCKFVINNDLLPCIDASYLNGDKKVIFGLRSEHISIEKNKYPFKATVYVSNIEELGTNSQIYADFNKEAALSINDSSPTRIIVKAPTGLKLSVGEKITVYFNLEKLQIFDATSEMTVNPRFPAFTRTSGRVSGNSIELFGTKIALPKALKLPKGKVDVSIPTEAMKLGGNISAKVLKIDTAEEFDLCVVKVADEYLFIKSPLKEKLRVGKTIKIGIDLKLVEFTSKGKVIKNIDLVNKVDASIVKEDIVKTHKNKKGKEYSLKENYCVLEILGYPNITNESLGLKLLSLRSKKIISRVVRVHFDPYCVQFAQEGIKCNITEILDYGTEKFAKVKTENKKEFIVFCNKPVSLGEAFIKIDINKTQIFDKEKDIRIA